MEKILCAAIWYKELEIKKELPSYTRNPVNIKSGIVFCGYRHMQALFSMVAITGLRQCEAGEEAQGFLTDKNRFVNREEAAEIALESGQVEKLMTAGKLFSEDLY